MIFGPVTLLSVTRTMDPEFMDLADPPLISPRPKFVPCAFCGKRVKVKAAGPLPMYCGNAHKQAAFQQKLRLMRPEPPAPTRDELAIRIWEVLTEFGLVTGEMPPAKPKPEPE
jgi:hypothetical protein